MLVFEGQGLNQFVGLMKTIRLRVARNSSKDSRHDSILVLFGSNATFSNQMPGDEKSNKCLQVVCSPFVPPGEDSCHRKDSGD